MSKCDQYTINNGIPSIVLMERAAHSVVHAILDEFDGIPKKTLVLCGIGNNAGDGLCMARELSDLSSDCTLLMTMGVGRLSGDARKQFNLLSKKGCTITTDKKSVEEKLNRYDLIVDAIFGTGLDRAIPKDMDEFLAKINQVDAFKCAVDVPTGINAVNGMLFSQNPFYADLTVTFAFPKSGIFFYPARKTIGKLKCSYIGISNETPEAIGWQEKYLMNALTAKKILPPSDPDVHKGTLGRLSVIGGSSQYKGAPLLTLKAALKTGTGMVKGIIPQYHSSSFFNIPPEIIMTNIPSSNDYLGYESLDEVLKQTEEADAFVIGPGLGRQYSTALFVRDFVSKTQKPLLIDADGLFAFSSEEALQVLTKRGEEIVLTPHMGEFSRLTGKSVNEIKERRFDTLREFSERHQCTVVLKDATTTICTQEGQIIVNITGNEGLATGGSGDVLAGIIGAFLARGLPGHRAAQLGVYLHGLTADIYKKEHESSTFTPSTVCEMLDEAMMTLR